jgi:predicted permease
MNLFITTIESVAVLLGIGLLGFWIIKRNIVPGKALGLLSPLALDIALPSLIFVNIIQQFQPTVYPTWWHLPLWWLFFTLITAGLTGLCMFLSKKQQRREFAISLFYQNAIFFPLAILTGMFGVDSFYPSFLFLFTMFYAAFFFSTSHLFFKRQQTTTFNWKRIFHPVLFATILGVGFKVTGSYTIIPDFVLSLFTLLGGMTIPLIMIILGGNVYNDFQEKGTLQTIEIAKFVLVKNFLFPLVFLIILLFLKPPYYVSLLILLQSAVPPVTAVPLITERFGGNRAITNQFIVASFILSLISLPLMVSLFSLLFPG